MTITVLLVFQQGLRVILRPVYRSHFLKIGREWSQYLQVPLTAQDKFEQTRSYCGYLVATFILLVVGIICAIASPHTVSLGDFSHMSTHALLGFGALGFLGLHGLVMLCDMAHRRRVKPKVRQALWVTRGYANCGR